VTRRIGRGCLPGHSSGLGKPRAGRGRRSRRCL
jgi:hypothetical protein